MGRHVYIVATYTATLSWQPVASYMYLYPTVNSTDIFTVYFSWIPLGKGREKCKS